jgi:hypothetical protein
MAQAALKLRGKNLARKIELANSLVTNMDGNPIFGTPNPPLAALTAQVAAITAKRAQWAAAQAQADAFRQELAGLERALDGLLTQEASYINNVTGGEESKILSIGAPLRAVPTPLGALPEVMNLVLREGDFEGTLNAGWARIAGARSYEIQISGEPLSATSWAFKMSATKSTARLEGLTSGAKAWVRVRAIGADNKPGPWSDPATKTVP